MKKVAVIGAGVMGTAIARGASRPGLTGSRKWSFTFFDPNPTSAREAAEATNGQAASSPDDAVQNADLILLAVKPQVQDRVLHTLPHVGKAVVVSIAAGRTLEAIAADLERSGQTNVPTVRVMPNLNALVGAATSALCANQAAAQEQIEAVRDLFSTVGDTFFVEEKLFPAFTAMAGSSPAWFFQIVDDLARAGVKHGLTKRQAAEAACSAMLGSAQTLLAALRDGGNAADLVDRVCSPGGTTIAGLLAAQNAGLGPAIVDAVDATVERDAELAAS